MTIPILSVIIPCYNSGQYLFEAIDSVVQYPDRSVYEVIIVDDGSTDAHTIQVLEEIKRKAEHRVIHQTNLGPGAARNAGIQVSQGKYLLLLDSDNRIRPDYITKGIAILNAHPKVGVVYGIPFFFGGSNHQTFKPAKFDLKIMIAENYIDNCAVLRKTAWEDVGGIDPARVVMSHADWDLWMRIGAKGWEFHYVDEVLFDYRIRKDSLVTRVAGSEKRKQMRDYVLTKNLDIVMDNYHQLLQVYQEVTRNAFRYMIKKMVKRVLKK